jgi:hypothetical protein
MGLGHLSLLLSQAERVTSSSTNELLEIYDETWYNMDVHAQGLRPPTKQGGKMSKQDLSPEERAARGKRLLLYGMFSLVLVTVVSLFLVLWLWLAPVGLTNIAINTTLIIGAITIIACVIVWFIYTKLILKE